MLVPVVPPHTPRPLLAPAPRQHVDVHVGHRLASLGAVLDGQGEGGGAKVGLKSDADTLRQEPEVRYLRRQRGWRAKGHGPAVAADRGQRPAAGLGSAVEAPMQAVSRQRGVPAKLRAQVAGLHCSGHTSSGDSSAKRATTRLGETSTCPGTTGFKFTAANGGDAIASVTCGMAIQLSVPLCSQSETATGSRSTCLQL